MIRLRKIKRNQIIWYMKLENIAHIQFYFNSKRCAKGIEEIIIYLWKIMIILSILCHNLRVKTPKLKLIQKIWVSKKNLNKVLQKIINKKKINQLMKKYKVEIKIKRNFKLLLNIIKICDKMIFQMTIWSKNILKFKSLYILVKLKT